MSCTGGNVIGLVLVRPTSGCCCCDERAAADTTSAVRVRGGVSVCGVRVRGAVIGGLDEILPRRGSCVGTTGNVPLPDPISLGARRSAATDAVSDRFGLFSA